MSAWRPFSAVTCSRTNVFGWMRMIVLLVTIPNTIVIRWKRMNLRIRYMASSVYFCLTRSMNYTFSKGLP